MIVHRAYRCEASSDIERILSEGLKPSKPILSDDYCGMDLPDWAFQKYVFAFPSEPAVICHRGEKRFAYSRIPDMRFAAYVLPAEADALLSFPVEPKDNVMVVNELRFPDMRGKSWDERVRLAKIYVSRAVPLEKWEDKWLLPSLAFAGAIEPSRIKVETTIGNGSDIHSPNAH